MSRSDDARSWLRANGLAAIASSIDKLTRQSKRDGKRTRRNWWAVLAGNKQGQPRRVGGVVFPVVPEARRRQLENGHARSVSATNGTPREPSTSKTSTRESSRPTLKPKTPRASAIDVVQAPRPFVKWAGGKRQLLAAILERIPEEFGAYHEPFLGGGAVFFALRPPKAYLSDSNERLVRTYRGIKDSVEDVIGFLSSYKNNRRFFLQMRRRDIDRRSDAEVAAWFIFLNKTGFNGLYRVNSKNRFNVPFSDNKRAQICDADNLRACARALANTSIESEDYSSVLDRAQPKDLVYFDPPYIPVSTTSYFTSYTARGFVEKDQIALRNLALQLKEKGVHVLVSNSPPAARLYGSESFSLREVFATRAVNSRADRRGKIAELLIS